MPLFSKSLEQANTAVANAAAKVATWEAKAADARAEATRVEAESGAAILEDESAAERLSLNVQTLERKARAFDQAAGEARRKYLDACRAALETEAQEEDRQAAADRKLASAHAAKVDEWKRKLEELDDCEWERASIRDSVTGAWNGQHLGRDGSLEASAHRHETRAAVIRYFLSTGTVPHDFYLIDNLLGTQLNRFAVSFNQGDYVPGSIHEARDSGIALQDA